MKHGGCGEMTGELSWWLQETEGTDHNAPPMWIVGQDNDPEHTSILCNDLINQSKSSWFGLSWTGGVRKADNKHLSEL